MFGIAAKDPAYMWLYDTWKATERATIPFETWLKAAGIIPERPDGTIKPLDAAGLDDIITPVRKVNILTDQISSSTGESRLHPLVPSDGKPPRRPRRRRLLAGSKRPAGAELRVSCQAPGPEVGALGALDAR